MLRVTFALSQSPCPELSYRDMRERFGDARPSLSAIRAAIIEIRSGKFPDWNVVGTAGSFFKNPIITKAQYARLHDVYPDLPGFEESADHMKVPLGYILDKICHIKGIEKGKVGTYQHQALVLVNNGGACAAEVRALAADIATIVQEKTGIAIEWEVSMLPRTE